MRRWAFLQKFLPKMKRWMVQAQVSAGNIPYFSFCVSVYPSPDITYYSALANMFIIINMGIAFIFS